MSDVRSQQLKLCISAMCNNSNTWNLGDILEQIPQSHPSFVSAILAPRMFWLSLNKNHAKVQAVSGRISICFFWACFRPCLGARSSRPAPWLRRPVARGWKRRRSREEDTTMMEEHAMAAAAAAGGKWIPQPCVAEGRSCRDKLFLKVFLYEEIAKYFGIRKRWPHHRMSFEAPGYKFKYAPFHIGNKHMHTAKNKNIFTATNKRPRGCRTPAANGIMQRLKKKAHRKLRLIHQTWWCIRIILWPCKFTASQTLPSVFLCGAHVHFGYIWTNYIICWFPRRTPGLRNKKQNSNK